ncbi:MAG TPA: hypothetical protein VKU40_18820 [Thermoanaerobaculia bacterium]|nr:hypothetical protein [Thermoanaerobaculia bacterium]
MLFERSILTVSVLATVAFAAAGVHAWAGDPAADLGAHVLYALAAALLVVFPHVWTLIYLAMTGRAAAGEVDDRNVSPRVLSRVKRNRRRAWPPLVLASLGALGTVALGWNAQVDTHAWTHGACFAATLAVQLWAVWAEKQSLWDNADLLTDLDARALAALDDAEAAPEAAS